MRVTGLAVGPGQSTAILGLDAPAGEVFINLVTGAALPDRGTVFLFGRPTASIRDGDEWLTLLDRFGIVSERAALLDGLSVVQNLALPFSLDIEPPANDIVERAHALAREAGLDEDRWPQRVGSLSGVERVRIRLGRALALDPAVLLLEHPTAAVASAPRNERVRLGRDISAITTSRQLATVIITADEAFAAAAANTVRTLEPATGKLHDTRGWFKRWRSV